MVCLISRELLQTPVFFQGLFHLIVSKVNLDRDYGGKTIFQRLYIGISTIIHIQEFACHPVIVFTAWVYAVFFFIRNKLGLVVDSDFEG